MSATLVAAAVKEESAARAQRDADERPSRDSVLRPTRDALRAPFVAAPKPPRVAPAPRVVAKAKVSTVVVAGAPPTATTTATRTMAVPAPLPAPAPAASTPGAAVVARFRREAVDRAMITLRARGIVAQRMREAAPGPVGLARELTRSLRRATSIATAFAAVGLLLGALLVPRPALVPTWGWLPGPVVGAAFGAGALAVLGFLVGAISLLFSPAAQLATIAGGAHVLVVARANDRSVASLLAHVVELEGEPIAHVDA